METWRCLNCVTWFAFHNEFSQCRWCCLVDYEWLWMSFCGLYRQNHFTAFKVNVYWFEKTIHITDVCVSVCAWWSSNPQGSEILPLSILCQTVLCLCFSIFFTLKFSKSVDDLTRCLCLALSFCLYWWTGDCAWLMCFWPVWCDQSMDAKLMDLTAERPQVRNHHLLRSTATALWRLVHLLGPNGALAHKLPS